MSKKAQQPRELTRQHEHGTKEATKEQVPAIRPASVKECSKPFTKWRQRGESKRKKKEPTHTSLHSIKRDGADAEILHHIYLSAYDDGVGEEK